MVRVLIALRRTVVRNQLARTNAAMLLIGAGLVLLSAVGTIWLGLVTYPNQAAATNVLALVFLLWAGGRIAQSALAGDAVLRPELFSLLPLDRRRLARSLLVVGLLDPAGAFMAIAFCALIARGAPLGGAATAVGPAPGRGRPGGGPRDCGRGGGRAVVAGAGERAVDDRGGIARPRLATRA
jgi:ABC-2 type transport system permease protein